MNIQNIQYQLRPRRLDEIFDFALLIIRKNFGTFLLWSAPVFLVLFGINLFILSAWSGESARLSFYSGEQLLPALLLIAEYPLFALPVILLNGNLVFEEKPGFKKSFQGFFGYIFTYITHVVFLRLLLVTFLAPFIVSLWFGMIRNFFISEVILLERLKGSRIGRRLTAMSHRTNDRTFAFWFLDAGLFLGFLLIGGYTWNYLIETANLAGAYWFLELNYFSLLSPINHLLIMSYWIFRTTARFLFYLDTRSLLEGWDIELMLIKGVRDTDN